MKIVYKDYFLIQLSYWFVGERFSLLPQRASAWAEVVSPA